ncbi:alpha/beta hydrolase [Nocardia amikacinitolerans]|uniref:alpha/beta hydrolase n=1 Tax=Nocardia amikacinitolerans TaxID=756689 RepID=UPI0020A2B52C|nr:alpha/beta hydrolase [Nocardia amikacinitolerans]MCP2289174.1 Pimeloyl-ACP methyl ester carboxylesterase [Nocardia amikacinitolerans]
MIQRVARSWFPRAALAALLLTTAACADDEPLVAPVPTLEPFLRQTLTWESCENYPGGAGLSAEGIECARVTVPLDYADPGGETARIAISRLRARGERVAAILTNPGGPGGPGLGMPVMLAKSPLAERFDVIGMDVRGLGASTPLVRCPSAEETRTERLLLGVGHTVGEVDQLEEEVEDYAVSCAAGSGTKLLSHVGTVDVARDLDVIRTVLGEQKLTYFGGSYGTRIGSTFAEMFPDRVRAMVLDGPLDPASNMSDPVVDAAAFQRAFEAYAADCATAPDCPLGTDPKQATEVYRKLTLPLIEHPAPTTDQRGVDFVDAVEAVIASMYSPRLWPDLTAALAELSRGRGDALQAITSGHSESVGMGVHSAVNCLEEVRVTDRAQVTEWERRIREVAPIFDSGLPVTESPLDICAFWPVPPNWQPHPPVITGLPKVVVVAATGDPATPYERGVRLAEALDASLISYEATQHGVAFKGVRCVDEPVMKYLIELVPPPDTRCALQR